MDRLTGSAAHERPGAWPSAGERRVLGPDLRWPDEAIRTIPALLLRVAAERRDGVALRAKHFGIYREITCRQLLTEVTRIALGLTALGIGKGDRVAIMGDPVPAWMYTDLAAQCIGAVSYGLYPTSSRTEVQYLLGHGGASLIVAEDQEHVDKILPVLDRLPDVRKLVVIDTSFMFGYEHPALMSLQELIALGEDVPDGDKRFRMLCEEVKPDDPATIVYTSGTSAHPKGALYTHSALVVQGHQFFAFPELQQGAGFRSVVHLPLNHLYERMNSLVGPLVKGLVPHFCEDVGRFTETLHEVVPQYHASVPRYWSKLASRLIVGVESSSRIKQLSYKAAMSVGRAYRERRWAGERAVFLAMLYRVARWTVFNRMLRKIGLDRVRIALSAGAPLPAEVQALWQIWGVNLKNLYGQTEAGVVTAQFDRFPRPGAVGTPYPGVQVGLDQDGEVVATGPGCFAGYWNDAQATAEVFLAGGVHTGDVGEFDTDGQLRLVDRKKDIVITAGGKNISPSRIETVLKSSPYISEACIIGEGRKYVSALIEMDVGTVSEWAREHSVVYTSYAALARHPGVQGLFERELARCNEQLGRVEQVKAFRVLDRELDPELEGEAITPTRKIKRALLQKHFGHLIEQMYSDETEQQIVNQVRESNFTTQER